MSNNFLVAACLWTVTALLQFLTGHKKLGCLSILNAIVNILAGHP